MTQVATLHRCDADGRNIRLISANIEQDNTPWPLPDGRILYQRWEYVDRSQVDYHHLWTSNPDGSGVMVFFGNQHPGTVMIDAKPIPDTNKVVAIFSPGHGRREHAGHITVVDPSNGPDDGSRARQVTREDRLPRPVGLYRAICSWPPGMAASCSWTARAGRRRSTTQRRGAGGGPGCPRAAAAHRRARANASFPTVPIRPAATGTLLLVNAYKGRNMDGVRPGEIKKLLVLESLPKPINYTGGMDPLTYGGSFTLERVLGTVPVEADGSAAMELPALRSVFFVALDENDMAIKRMQSFTTVQPGEVSSCIGCHEQRTETYLSHDTLKPLSGRPSRSSRSPTAPTCSISPATFSRSSTAFAATATATRRRPAAVPTRAVCC